MESSNRNICLTTNEQPPSPACCKQPPPPPPPPDFWVRKLDHGTDDSSGLDDTVKTLIYTTVGLLVVGSIGAILAGKYLGNRREDDPVVSIELKRQQPQENKESV